MKRRILILLGVTMMFLLVACGSSADSSVPESSRPTEAATLASTPSSAQTQASTNPATETVAPESTLDEVIEDVLNYVKSEGMIVVDGYIINDIIALKYATEGPDSLRIFNSLCAEGFIKEQTNEPEFDISAGPILINGTFARGFTAIQVNIETKEETTVFSFSNNGTYTFAFDALEANYLGCYFAQQLFDDNLTKLAVSWYNQSNASRHVGWIDGEGNLTDVTERIHPHTTDFSSKTPDDRYALFSPEGYFVFTDMNDECYCFFDVNTMSIVKSEPFIIDDTSYFDNEAWQITFMPNGNIKALWHTKRNVGAIDFGECNINMPDSSYLKSWDYINDNIILCVGNESEGYYIAEVGEGIGEKSLSRYAMHNGDGSWNYSYHGTYADKDGVEKLKITPYTDYRIEKCAYSSGQIAFIASRGNERFLFVVENSENSNPVQVKAVSTSWNLLFWK